MAVSINAYRNCGPAAKKKIAMLRDSLLGIDQWISYVRHHDLNITERYLEDKTVRFTLPPESTPLGDRFILLGGVLETEGAEVFDLICRVNSRRMTNIDLHFPLDAIDGPTASVEHERPMKAVDPRNDISRALNTLWEMRGVGSVVYYDDHPLVQLIARSSMPILSLYWHPTIEGLIENLSEGILIS